MVQRLIFAMLLAFGIFSCETQTYQGGNRLYELMCANCHMESGEGLGALIPPLANSDFLAKNREKLPCILKYGLHDTIVVNNKTYAENMTGVLALSEIQITNLLNYVNSSWGNNNPPYTFEEVRGMLEKAQKIGQFFLPNRNTNGTSSLLAQARSE